MIAKANERMVLQMTLSEKLTIAAKAKKFDMSVSELMRRGALAYSSDQADQELGALADAAKGAADRAGSAIDDAMSFIDASNKRIASMEAAPRAAF